MLIYQISLHGSAFDARSLSWEEAIQRSGCRPNRKWRDPLLDRPLLKGEFGCAVSHLRIWEKIAASGRAGLVLEEDAVFDSIDPREVEMSLYEHDSAWLGWRENSLGYWYNAHAYAITPEAAALLIDGFAEQIIPADEWLPKRLAGRSNFFFRPERVKQIPRDTRPSTIEETETMDQDIDFRIITVATEPEKAQVLFRSANKYGVKIINLGDGSDWRDDMAGRGGMPKIQMVNSYLKDVPEDAIVLYLDGYDTFLADSPLEILNRYLGFGSDIVFGAEDRLWPESDLHFEPTGTKYKYLNSGCYIGRAGALHRLIAASMIYECHGDDQMFMQHGFLYGRESAVLDAEAYIFQNHEPNIEVVNGQLMNLETNCCGCVYHGNGGVEAKKLFNDLARRFGFKDNDEVRTPYIMTLDYEEVAPEILVCDFLTQRQCDYLIQQSERHGNWGQLDGDKFPAQEIRLKKLGLWHEYERLWHEKLGQIAMKHWKPYQHIGLRDAFTMKYTMDTQRALGFHTDASLVTGSVKLNDAYEGAELIFPRQNFDNTNVAVGRCILFPSDVTHGHYVPELQSGIKYSLTMWTSRFKGDVN
jgi:hypothetical protein